MVLLWGISNDNDRKIEGIAIDSIGTWYYYENTGRWVKNECTRTGVEKP